ELEVYRGPQRRQERSRLGKRELHFIVADDRGLGDEVALTHRAGGYPALGHEGGAFCAATVQDGGVVPAADVGRRRFGVERRAVVEGYAVTKHDVPDRGVIVGGPLGGEAGDEVGSAGLEVDESLGDLAADDQGVTVLGVDGIERGWEAADAVNERLGTYH